MNYTLNKFEKGKTADKKVSFIDAAKGLAPIMKGQGKNLGIAFAAILVTSVSLLSAPLIISHAINDAIVPKDYHGVLVWAGILLAIYLVGLVTQYVQTIRMGTVGRNVLFNLRNALFNKLQELPVAFFNQNKAGDLISRINNDTDQLNQFFSQALMQFVGNFFQIVGAGIFLLALDIKLGAAALIPALLVLVITQLISPWVKRRNLRSLQSLGGMSAEIQESIENFKVIVAFNRLDYFRKKFSEANEINYGASVKAGVANNLFAPLYGIATNLAQLIVLAFGIYSVSTGSVSIGLLIGFFLYVNNFYFPLQQIASVWSSFQLALAGFDRISEILALESDIKTISESAVASAADDGGADDGADSGRGNRSLLEFRHVSFGYPNGREVLRDINLRLEKGKTYALVGPTGGGKTTTASLMARLYDPTKGQVILEGRDIRTYMPDERVQKIGFITQEPFLFTGTVRDNIIYGNLKYRDYSSEALREVLEQAGLSNLLARFDEGLETRVSTSGSTISLGQKQLIAFIRAVLRDPELLILDEATANIDTVTEQLLDDILDKLPASTTKVIIAHRLNTINNADEIFFVNSGEVIAAGSMENAVEMLLHGKRES
jgi:ATP-binding cassette subfamily B protein